MLNPPKWRFITINEMGRNKEINWMVRAKNRCRSWRWSSGCCAVLFKKVPKLPYTLCYISRGFVVDYSNKEALNALLDSAKEIAKAEKTYAIKIDPDVEVDKGTDALQNLKSAWF